MKKNNIYIIIFITTILFGACSPQPILPNQPQKRISIRLPVGYIPNIQFAPLYMAIEKGYYSQEGLDITIDYRMENDNVALLGVNQIQFAVVSGEQVLLGRAQGVPIVYVMTWYQNYPVGVVSKISQEIKHPADLKGKKIGVPILAGASYIGLRALLDAAGLKESDVTLDVIGYNQVEALATDQEQASVIYITNEPIQLRSKGYEVNVLRVADYLQLVANGLVTNEKTLQENPELVKKMVRATLKGIKDTVDNSEQAFLISEKYVENLSKADKKVQKQILDTSIELWKTKNMGFTEKQAWENMQQLLLRMKLIKEPLDLNKAFTNDFLP